MRSVCVLPFEWRYLHCRAPFVSAENPTIPSFIATISRDKMWWGGERLLMVALICFDLKCVAPHFVPPAGQLKSYGGSGRGGEEVQAVQASLSSCQPRPPPFPSPPHLPFPLLLVFPFISVQRKKKKKKKVISSWHLFVSHQTTTPASRGSKHFANIPDGGFSRTRKMLKRSEQREVKNTNRLDRRIPREVSHNSAVDEEEK